MAKKDDPLIWRGLFFRGEPVVLGKVVIIESLGFLRDMQKKGNIFDDEIVLCIT